MWRCEICGWMNLGARDGPCTGFKVEPVGHMLLAGYTAQEILGHEPGLGLGRLDGVLSWD